MNFENQISISVKSKLSTIPRKPGVYKFIDKNGKVLYVGKAIDLRNRVKQYFSKSKTVSSRIKAMVTKTHDIEYIVTDSEVEALILEANLIKRIKPYYNIDLKDDKSYPYIGVTNEPYPRVIVTRRLLKDGTKYFGPYTDVKNMRTSLKMIRDIFRIRSCDYLINEETIRKHKLKVCLDYHIKKCDGPCEGLISEEKYKLMVNEVVQVLKGKLTSLVNELENKMAQASEELKYEEAAELRDKILYLNIYREKQKIVDIESVDRDIFVVAIDDNVACGVVFNVREGKIVDKKHIYINGVQGEKEETVLEHFLERYYLVNDDVPPEILLPKKIPNVDLIKNWLYKKSKIKTKIITQKDDDKANLLKMCQMNAALLLSELKMQKKNAYLPNTLLALQKDLNLLSLPRRIECFDVSNIQGIDNVASMVVFVDGKPRKSEYRRYNIQSVSGQDDYASIREVMKRRYDTSRDNIQNLPDLIVIDGGKGQLNSALQVIQGIGDFISESIKEKIQIIGIAKRLEEVYLPGKSEPINIKKDSPGLLLLQRIRNEAHRFAIEHHRKLRKKRVIKTELEDINGIGIKRARKLLQVFGSLQNVKSATLEQLQEVIGKSVALKIKEYFE